MKCNKCEAELEEGVTLCPNCGYENAPAEETAETAAEETVETVETADQETPAEEEKANDSTPIKEGKLTPGKIALLVALAVVAVAVVIALIVGGMGGSDSAETNETTVATVGTGETVVEETTETTEATIPADGNPDDVTCKGTYTVTDDEIIAAQDTVVATLGDAQLTNGELQIYYWMQFYDFMNSYGTYASVFGLDYTQSLDTQLSVDGVTTWQQYFLSGAISMWQSYAALQMDADKAGYELDADYVDFLANLPETLEASAASSGFESAQLMLEADMGKGVSLEDYIQYMNEYYVGYLYYESLTAAMEVTDDEVEAYFDENAETFAESGIEKDDQVYVDVRHILVCPEGGTTDEEGNVTYSEEEWEACRASAQAILDQWAAGEATEEAFAQLANEQSMDTGSNTNGGLYEDVYVGQMVEPFETWCFDTSRVYGDTGLVQTDYGYHVMFFVESNPVWFAEAQAELLNNKSVEILENSMASYELNVDYSAIELGFVDFSTEE